MLPAFFKKPALLFTIAFIAYLHFPEQVGAKAEPVVTYNHGLLTLKAEGAPLVALLKAISEKTGIEISISKALNPEAVSIGLAGAPLEQALHRVLRRYSYATVYTRRDGQWTIASLKVYPQGRVSGEVVSLLPRPQEKAADQTALKTVLYPSGESFVTFGGLETAGLMIPSRSVPVSAQPSEADMNAPWFKLQKQFEQEENRQYAELILFQKKTEAADNPESREALTMAYADQVERFYSTKKANFNKIEALKRICQARETANGNRDSNAAP